ncbi:hypothetical protein DC487_07280 [Sphingobacterium corticibacter]|uniref:Uncharacterized protein n=1 Tax=Sphingobacterium corticibacter TaxID=2171749 RepID=A0A2T8HJW6_9SPHI|nr:hypothetical protein DC487_07280 [Sphingobacterium corticibacter]
MFLFKLFLDKKFGKNQDCVPYCYQSSEILNKTTKCSAQLNKLATLKQIFVLYGFAFRRLDVVGTLGRLNQ